MAFTGNINTSHVACGGVKTVMLLAGSEQNGSVLSLNPATGGYVFQDTNTALGSSFVARIFCDGVLQGQSVMLFPEPSAGFGGSTYTDILNLTQFVCSGIKTVALVGGSEVNGTVSGLSAGGYTFNIADVLQASEFKLEVFCDGVFVGNIIILIPPAPLPNDLLATGLSYIAYKFSRNQLTHIVPAANPALTSRQGLKYLLDLWIPEFPLSPTFYKLHTSDGREKPIQQIGMQVYEGCEFRYNRGRWGKIDGLLSHTKPLKNQSNISTVISQTTAYRLKERVSGGVPAVNTAVESVKNYVVKAGLSNIDYWNFRDTFFDVYLAQTKKFLTWHPQRKLVSYEQEEYLSFLLNFTPKPTSVNLRMRWFDDALVASPITTVKSINNTYLHTILLCPVGASVLGLPAAARRYEVWLSDGNNNRLSEIRQYEIDQRFEPYQRQVIFNNSLGGWDTLRAIGEGQRTMKVAQTAAERERSLFDAPDYSEMRIVSIKGDYEWTISTGNFDRSAVKYIDYLNELLLAEDLFLATPKGHVPVLLTSSTLVDVKDNPDLISRTFTFKLTETVENYSDLPVSAPVEARPTGWAGINETFVLDDQGFRTGQCVYRRLQRIYLDDNSIYFPLTIKPNLDGLPDYVAPAACSAAVPGFTPYPNVLIDRPCGFTKNDCPVGEIGTIPNIVILAGSYGGEEPGDADILAENEFTLNNTQAFANANGSCILPLVIVECENGVGSDPSLLAVNAPLASNQKASSRLSNDTVWWDVGATMPVARTWNVEVAYFSSQNGGNCDILINGVVVHNITSVQAWVYDGSTPATPVIDSFVVSLPAGAVSIRMRPSVGSSTTFVFDRFKFS